MIQSTQNEKIKQIQKLKTTKERQKQQAFLVEGYKTIKEIPKDFEITALIVSSAYQGDTQIVDTIDKNKILQVSEQVFNCLSDTTTPQGILAVVKEKQFTLDQLTNKQNPFIILIENLQDPGNLGTIIRTADAMGACGIVLSKGTVDLYNTKVVRSTMGSLFHLPIIQKADLTQTIQHLKQCHITTYATHLQGTKAPAQCSFTKSCAILIGNEGNGLTDQITNLADEKIKIPMPGKAQSLNASIAATILMYEIMRQRQIVNN